VGKSTVTFSSTAALLRDRVLDRRRRHQKLRYTPLSFAEYLRQRGAQVGTGCFIASIDLDVGIETYLLKIGNHVAIDREVSLLTHDGAAWVFRDQIPDLQVCGPIIIEDNCFIGRGAILCPGVRVGPNSIVAAGAVVISDVAANTVVAGIPARPVAPLKTVGGASEQSRS
jgi:acetyltransferase-like isoleucine patch superfamily enzyme